MGWLLNPNNTTHNEKNITVSNAPIKKVQAYRILGLDDELDEDGMTEDEKRVLSNTLNLFESGLIDVESARRSLGFI